MKQLAAAVLVGTMILTLCACGGSQQTAASVAETTASVGETTSAAPNDESSKKPSAQESKKPSAQESKKESTSSQASQKTSKAESKKEASKEVSKAESKASKPESQASVEKSSDPVSEPSEHPSVASEPEPESSVPEEPRSEEPEQPSAEESSVQPNPPKPRTPSNGSPVDAAWFDDALFIGDSVTLKLSYYADYGSLGNAEFLCAGSLGYNNALWELNHPDNVHPSYNGVKYTVDEGARIINPNKIFIMLGMNDIGLYGVDGAIEGMKELTSRIEQKCPDADIYIESVTPMLEDMQLRSLNNRTIAEFDQKAAAVCEERGYCYLDIASAVEDEGGNLIYSYCSDPTAMGLHFSDAGCAQWVDYLKNHVIP